MTTVIQLVMYKPSDVTMSVQDYHFDWLQAARITLHHYIIFVKWSRGLIILVEIFSNRSLMPCTARGGSAGDDAERSTISTVVAEINELFNFLDVRPRGAQRWGRWYSRGGILKLVHSPHAGDCPVSTTIW